MRKKNLMIGYMCKVDFEIEFESGGHKVLVYKDYEDVPYECRVNCGVVKVDIKCIIKSH